MKMLVKEEKTAKINTNPSDFDKNHPFSVETPQIPVDPQKMTNIRSYESKPDTSPLTMRPKEQIISTQLNSLNDGAALQIRQNPKENGFLLKIQQDQMRMQQELEEKKRFYLEQQEMRMIPEHVYLNMVQYNQMQNNYIQQNQFKECDKSMNGSPENNSPKDENIKLKNSNSSNSLKIKENYLELLVNSALKLVEKGFKINKLKSLKSKPKKSLGLKAKSNVKSSETENLKKEENDYISPELNSSLPPGDSTSFNFKCGNKICPVIITKKSNLFHATFNSTNKSLWLCSLCYQAFKNGQYCFYCGVIYRKYKGTKGFNNHKTWIGCEFCNNWEHVQCEEANGVYHNLSKIIKKDKNFKYKCPMCRESSNISYSRKCSFTKDDTNEIISGSGERKKKEIDKLKYSSKKKIKKVMPTKANKKPSRKNTNTFDENSFEIDSKFKHVRVDDEKKDWLNDIKLLMEINPEK